ncbi:hypothetical protein WG66_014037 [Moniliophthora roreri]|nr:hypothetical protein WG66_014037 [Moniliophthora roreri]
MFFFLPPMLFSVACYPSFLTGLMLAMSVSHFLGSQNHLGHALRLPRLSSDPLFSSGSQRNLTSRDVYTPRITSPDEDTIWVIGEDVTVTWDISNPPVHITNEVGEIWLGCSNGMNGSKYLGAKEPLLRGFDIRIGSVGFTVPRVEPRNDYFICSVTQGTQVPSLRYKEKTFKLQVYNLSSPYYHSYRFR